MRRSRSLVVSAARCSREVMALAGAPLQVGSSLVGALFETRGGLGRA